MIYILGILSLLQILLLPGTILLKFFKIEKGCIQNLVFTFGLSLIFNFLWVFGLTIFSINYPAAHYILFVIEIVIFLWLYRDALLAPIESHAKVWVITFKEMPNSLAFIFQKDEGETFFSRLIKTIIYTIFLLWAISGLIWFSTVLIDNWGTAFKLWDAVVSWNRWAVNLSNNLFSSNSRYPLLIPANFSITYSFLRNSEIQIFAKSIMPIFTLFTWLLMLDLAFEYKKPGIFIGMVITRYLTKKFLYKYLGEGYVDVALLFFSFLTVYALLKADRADEDSTKTQYLYLGAIFAAGTALTKQNGLLIFAFYPLLAYLLVTDNMMYKNTNERLRIIFKPILLGLIVLLPWYIFNETRIILGLNSTNVLYLMSADRHNGRTYLERVIRAFEILEIYSFLFPFVLITFPLIQKKFRQIALIIIFPYTLIWAFLFSIFPRNLAMVFPFLGITAGLGVEGLINFTLGLGEKVKLQRIKSVVYLSIFIMLILGAGVVYTDQKIYDTQIEEQKEALFPGVNIKLYEFFENEGFYGPIMTKYPIRYLPHLEKMEIREPFTSYKEFYDNFSAHPEAKYFLIWGKYSSKEVLEMIKKFQSAGAIEYHFKSDNLEFYEVINRDYILDNQPN